MLIKHWTMCQRHLTPYYCCSMIHADLMLVVVEVLIVLDLEPLGPLPGVVTLAGFAEHTAHSVWPLPIITCGPSGLWVHNGSQCVTMCRCPGPSLDWTLAAVFSPGPACAADTCDAQAGESSLPHHISDAVNVIIILSHMSKHDTLKWEGKYLHALNSQKSAISSLSNCIIMYNG